MADEFPQAPVDSPVPPPPSLQAPTQTISVIGLVGPNRGKAGRIPVETYADLAKQGKVELLLPTQSPDGAKGYTPLSKWAEKQKQKFSIRTDDDDQLPLAYQLSKQLQDRDPEALERFLQPFWSAVVSSTPDWLGLPKEPTILPIPDIRKPNLKEETEIGATMLTGGMYPIVAGGLKQVLNIPHAWVAAAKKPAGEGTAAAVSALPVPFAPEIATATQGATTGNWAGALGNAGLAGGMLLFQELGPKIAGLGSKIGESTPDLLTSTKQARNLGAQREIVAKTNEISPQLNPQDLRSIRESAGAEVRTADQLNEEAKQFEERGKQQAAVDQANLKDIAQRGAAAAEQTRRVLDRDEVERLATEVSETISRPPIQQAEHVIEVAQQVEGVTNEIERAIYPYIYREAERANIQTDVAPVAHVIARELRSAAPAQAQLGTAGLSARAIEPAAKMQAGAVGHIGTIDPNQMSAYNRLRAAAEAGELDPEQLSALNMMMGAIGGSENLIPFEVADQAQRGLGASIRYLQKAKATNPNVAPDLRLLQTIQAQLKEQINASLAPNYRLQELYDTAHNVTREQHDIIDQNVIKKMFTDPRNRLAGETLVKGLMQVGTEKLQGAILQALDIGPAAQQALERIRQINPQEAERISQRISDLAAPSDAARRGLRRMVVDAAIQKATTPSKIVGVDAPEIDFNAMIGFFDKRPSAKILLGEQYEPMMRDLRARADARLRQTDPAYQKFIQQETARYEIKRTPVEPPEGAKAVRQELSEAEFVKKLTSDGAFRRAAVRNATPEIRRRMVRSVIEDATRDAMVRGVPGSPDAVMDFEKWGKNLADRAEVISELGGVPEAARQLQGLGRAAERASQAASTGLVSHIYAFFTSFGMREVRMSASLRPGVYRVGPKQIGAQVGVPEPPVELPATPRNLDQDLVRASQDPELARMMKRALKLQPWEPGAGTEALKYYLAFAGGKPSSGKALDDKTAAAILQQAGYKIDVAVPIAQAQGYTR